MVPDSFYILEFGYCPPPATVSIRGRTKGYIQPYSIYFPTVTEGGPVPKF